MVTEPLNTRAPYVVTSPLHASVQYHLRLYFVRAMELIQAQKLNGVIHWTLYQASAPQVQTIYIARNAVLNQGIYYCLFILVLALIVWTLPRAIIAWKERI